MPLLDVGIIMGLTEEFEVFRDIFPELHEEPDAWYRCRLSVSENTQYEVVAAFQNKMGPLDAHELTTKIVQVWDPAVIFLIGIAGSFDKDARLGDVLVSQQVFYYDLGKATEKGLSYRPEGYPCYPTLIKQLEAAKVDRETFRVWQRNCKQAAKHVVKKIPKSNNKTAQRKRKVLEQNLVSSAPQLLFGSVASGSLVVAAQRKRVELRRLHGKLLGTEMEGAGMMHAAYGFDVPVPAVVVKGVSDHSDDKKAKLDEWNVWRELATGNAVRFVLSALKRGRIRPLGTNDLAIDTSLPANPAACATVPLGEAVGIGVRYVGFQQFIRPKGPLTNLDLRLELVGASPGFILDAAAQVEGGGREMLFRPSGPIPQKCVNIALPALRSGRPIGIYMAINGNATGIRAVARCGTVEKDLEIPLD